LTDYKADLLVCGVPSFTSSHSSFTFWYYESENYCLSEKIILSILKL